MAVLNHPHSRIYNRIDFTGSCVPAKPPSKLVGICDALTIMIKDRAPLQMGFACHIYTEVNKELAHLNKDPLPPIDPSHTPMDIARTITGALA